VGFLFLKGGGMKKFSKIFLAILVLAGLSGIITTRSAHSVGATFQTECAHYNGANTVTFIYPVGEKSAVEDCLFVNPNDLSQFQCTDGAGLGHIQVCITDPDEYNKIPKLYAVVVGCNFDPDCQKNMAQHLEIYRNFTNIIQPDTITHDGDDIDFSHIHLPDLDAVKPAGIPANIWAIQGVFPCDQNGCGPQVRIEKVPTSISEMNEMIAQGKLTPPFPFPRHFPVLLPEDAQCPNHVLRIPVVQQACDPSTHHVPY
jgi:hypothetical protein